MIDATNAGPSHLRTASNPAERAIRQAFESVGVTRFQVAHEIAKSFGITAKQARRKLKAGIWTLDELLALQRRCRVSLDGVLEDECAGDPQGPGQVRASLFVNGESTECEVQLGQLITTRQPRGLVCSRHRNRWVVSTANYVSDLIPQSERFAVHSIRLVQGSAPLRVAVLDDELQASQSLADWFSENGHPAQSFTRIEQLEAAGLDAFDVFIIDVVLGSNQTSYELVLKIRNADPEATVVMLTGKLRAPDIEARTADFVRDHRVEFHAKPTSPLVLLSTVINAAERRHRSATSD